MPESITEIFVQQYQNTMRLLCQQRDSRLEGTTIPPVKMEGEYLYWERLGPTEAVDLEVRHGNTPNIEQDHSRRRSTAKPKVWATLLDRADAGRMLVDPKGPYQEAGRMAMRRAKDRIIITALGGTSCAGKDGTTPVVLPSTQKIAHSDVGLTLTKILTAKEMLDAKEVEGDRYFIHASAQSTDMLNTTEIKSADYNSVKALVEGKIDTFLGFKFIRLELLVRASSIRYCYAYAKGAIGFGTIEDMFVKLTEESTKNFSWQPYLSMDMGATRIEEEQVIEVACYEP